MKSVKQKILIHAPNWLGDHVMAFPFYATLYFLFPNHELHIIARSWVEALLPSFKHNASDCKIFQEVIVLSNKNPTNIQMQYLKEQKYCMAITLSPSFRSALLLKKINIPIRIGYKTDYRKFLLKYPIQTGALQIPPLNIYEHRSLSYIRLLSNYFADDKTAENYWSESINLTWLLKSISTIETNIQFIHNKQQLTSQEYLVIAPGSVSPARTYPIKNIIYIIQEIIKLKPNLKIVLVGSKLEKEYGIKITEQISCNIINLIGETDLNELLFLLKGAKAVFANDSGIAHLTFLTKTKLITSFGMGRKWETVSLNPNKTVLNLHLKCSPCMNHICKYKNNKHLQCLLAIDTSQIINLLV